MNVGIVTTWFERGAAYVSRQFKSTLEQNYTVYIYARGGEKQILPGPEWEGASITRGKETPLTIETSIDRSDFCRWITEKNIEIVLFNEQRWWLPILWCRQLGLKVGAYVDYYTENTVKFFDLYDFLICNTKRHYSVFNWHPQCFFIPWGTDVDLFTPTNNYQSADRELTFFHSAGMNPCRKGTDLLLQAFSQLPGKSKLVIHSQVDLAATFPSLQPVISKLQQESQLDIIVKTVPAPGLYHLGDVYVYPSRLDGIGLSLVEAAACGLPLIATDSPPMNEFVSAENGKLVKVESFLNRHDGYYWPQTMVSVQSLCDAMNYYVLNNAMLHDFKRAARTFAEKYFNWNMNSAELCRIFAETTHRTKSSVKESEILAENFERERGGIPVSLEDGSGLIGKLRSFVERMTG